MAFCSYFKIQPVAGGADRIKKSEWKLVSHDNSQPPRERQLLPLLLLLLSPDFSSPSLAASASLYLSASSIYVSSPFCLFSCLTAYGSSLPLYYPLLLILTAFLSAFLSRFCSPPMLICSPHVSPNLSPAQPLPPVSLPPLPSLSPSSTALNTTAICVHIYTSR